MNSNKRRIGISSAIGLLIGLACALVLGAIFYGAMAYQLADGSSQGAGTEAPKPDALLALSGAQLLWEQTNEQEVGGQRCTVTTRVYRTEEGLEAEVVSASPAAYIARLSEEKWTAQLITGFTLAGLDAVYSLRGGEGMLSCRDGERIYMLRCAADEQTLYAMGASAYLE